MGWKKIDRVDQNRFNVEKWVCEKTGMTVCIADVPGPACNGYFCLATEARDDAGLPHTLEHLVFMSSKEYPYKGTLDLIANRNLSDGTNAWTAVDHTAYTMETMGAEGFLGLVGPFLDHLLRPLLTDESFTTEVHHVTGEGEDAGVVYCEMQAREHTPDDLLALARARAMWGPCVDCGYSSETGGLCPELRKLTNQRVRDYHRANYRPENMCLIVCGQVPADQLFAQLDPVLAAAAEAMALSKSQYRRPFSDPLPPFTESVTEDVLFPDADASVGQAVWSTRGPAYQDYFRRSALSCLWKYLTESAVSPFRRAFVDCPDPLASTLYPSHQTYREMEQTLEFDGVPTSKLNLLEPLMRRVLLAVVGDPSAADAAQDRSNSEPALPDKLQFDLGRMRDLLALSRRELLDSLETSTAYVVVDWALPDFLYGPRETDGTPSALGQACDELTRLEQLMDKDSDFWCQLLRDELLARPWAFFRGRPSPEYAQRLQAEEKERVATQKRDLGPDKLRQLAVDLDTAMAAAVPPPQAVLEQFPIADALKVPLIPVETLRGGPGAGAAADLALAGLPFPVQVDSCAGTQFVEWTVFFNTSHLDGQTARFLELWLDCVFELPIEVPAAEAPAPGLTADETTGMVLVPHDVVVSQLDRDTTARSNGLGVRSSSNFVCGSFPGLAYMRIKVERAQAAVGLRWLKHLLWFAQYPVERLLIAAKRLLKDVPSFKRNGSRMARAGLLRMLLDDKSNHRRTSVFEQQAFLLAFVRDLELSSDEGEAHQAAQKFAQFARELPQPGAMVVHVACDVASFPVVQVADMLTQFAAAASNGVRPTTGAVQCPMPSPPATATHCIPEFGAGYEKLANDDVNPEDSPVLPVTFLATIDAVDGAFVSQCSPAPRTVTHPDVAPLQIALQYFSALEGPFWTAVRGAGLAYGCGWSLSIETGAIMFYIYRSAKPAQAYEAASGELNKIMLKPVGGGGGDGNDAIDSDVVNFGGCQFSLSKFEAARSLCMQEIISQQTTLSACAHSSFLDWLRGYPANQGTQQKLNALAVVAPEDMARVLKRWASGVFDPRFFYRMVVSNPTLAEEIVSGFGMEGQQPVERIPDLSGFFLGPERAVELAKLVEEMGEDDSDESDDEYESEEDD